MILVSTVDDEKELSESIATFINGSPGFRCISSYGSAQAALKALPADRPDVVLMDINMAGMTGIECVAQLKELMPEVQTVMLTVYEDTGQIFNALSAGASGYLLKRSKPSKLLEAIREVHEGAHPPRNHGENSKESSAKTSEGEGNNCPEPPNLIVEPCKHNRDHYLVICYLPGHGREHVRSLGKERKCKINVPGAAVRSSHY